MAEGRELYEQCKQLEKSITRSKQGKSRCRREAERIRLRCILALEKPRGIECCTEESNDWPFYRMAEERAKRLLKRLE